MMLLHKQQSTDGHTSHVATATIHLNVASNSSHIRLIHKIWPVRLPSVQMFKGRGRAFKDDEYITVAVNEWTEE